MMEGTGSGKGASGSRRDEDDRARQQDFRNQGTNGNPANPSDRRPFNPGRNVNLHGTILGMTGAVHTGAMLEVGNDSNIRGDGATCS
jgi:hypothetical protein